MADLPAPFTVSEYTKPAVTKLKITMPARASTSKITIPPTQPSKSPTTATVTAPTLKQKQESPKTSAKSKSDSKAIASVPSPAAEPKPIPPVVQPPPPQPPVQAPQVQAPQVVAAPAPISHYPNAAYGHDLRQTTHSPAVPAAPAIQRSVSAVPAPVITPSPVQPSTTQSPAPSFVHPLQSVSLRVQPRGRLIELDHRDGVKCWALRLIPGENEVHINNVLFIKEDDGDSAAEEDDGDDVAKVTDDDQMQIDAPIRSLRKKGKSRTKGRQKETPSKAKAKGQAEQQSKPKLGPVQVKLNSLDVREEGPTSGSWVIRPNTGMSTLEVGELGGLTWKVYVQKID
jgi:chromatin structure-remodeling complex subunit RSC4